jgi:probable addiction module antidote protein
MDDYAALDIASHLDNEEVIAEYLTAAAGEDDPRVLLAAMSEVAKSRGLAQVAAAAGIERENLTAALSGEGAPSFETIRAVLRGLGVKLAIEPAKPDPGEKAG